MAIPYMLLNVVLAVIIAYAFESQFKTSAIYVIPQEYHNFLVKGLWLMEECWFTAHAAVLVIMTPTTHVLSMEKYLQTITSLKASLHGPRQFGII